MVKSICYLVWHSTHYTMYDFHDSTDTSKFWREKWAINKTFFVFHPILMKLGEIVVHMYLMDNYNFTKFDQNRMKNKKDLLIAHFSVKNFKVSVELWKSYIVRSVHTTPIMFWMRYFDIIWSSVQCWIKVEVQMTLKLIN